MGLKYLASKQELEACMYKCRLVEDERTNHAGFYLKTSFCQGRRSVVRRCHAVGNRRVLDFSESYRFKVEKNIKFRILIQVKKCSGLRRKSKF